MIVAVVAPVLHKYVYGAVPLVAETVAVPLFSPQDVSTDVVLHTGDVLSATFTEHSTGQPLLSVTVTV